MKDNLLPKAETMFKNPLVRVVTSIFIALVVLRVIGATLRWWSRDDGQAFVQAMVSSERVSDADARRLWAAGGDEIRRMTQNPKFVAYVEQHGGAGDLGTDGLGRLTGQDLLASWQLRAAWSEHDPAFCAGIWTGDIDDRKLSAVLSQATDAALRWSVVVHRVVGRAKIDADEPLSQRPSTATTERSAGSGLRGQRRLGRSQAVFRSAPYPAGMS